MQSDGLFVTICLGEVSSEAVAFLRRNCFRERPVTFVIERILHEKLERI